MKHLMVLCVMLPGLCSAQTVTQSNNGITGIYGVSTSGVPSEKPKPWHLVTRLNNGSISVSRYETKDDCEHAKRVVEHIPDTDDEKAYSHYFDKKRGNYMTSAMSSYMRIGTDIQNIECLDW